MAALRTVEHFIRQRMTVNRSRRMSITLRPDGRFEASYVHADGRTATVEVADDPADALWNALAPFPMRRVVTVSGRTLAVDEDVPGRVFLGGGVELLPADLDELLGGSPNTAVAPVLMHADDLEDLLG